jgi:hypothetical protein
MKRARAWAMARMKSSERASLDTALLTGRGARYATARLGVAGARAIARTALHAAEVWILARVFPYEFLAPLFMLRALPGLVTGLHWGALEGLRAEVRQALVKRERELARVHIEAWLALTGLLGAALMGAAVWFVSSRAHHDYGPDGLYGSFALLCALLAASELWTRTYHSGVFALGRVHRPVWSFFVPDALELLVLVWTAPRIGPFSLHATVLFGLLVRTAITMVFARRAYRARRLPLPHPVRLRALGRLGSRELGSSFKHLLASVPLQLDRMLLVALLAAPAPAPGVLPLALPYYALRPIAGFAQSWARTFYVDFVRLDMAAVSVLRARFERFLRRVALVAGALSALTLALGSYLIFGPAGLGAAAWLAPLSLVRARFTLDQVRAFAYGALPALLRTGSILLVGLVVTSRLDLPDRTMVLVILAILAAAQLAFRAESRAAERRSEHVHRLSLSAWLAELSMQTAPVRVAIALVDTRVARPGALLTVLAGSLERGHIARFGHAWLVWWEPAASARPLPALATQLAGAVQNLELVRADSGARALEDALERRLLPRDLAQALAMQRPRNVHVELRARALELVPDCLTLDLHGQSPALARIPHRELTVLRRAILAEAREQYIVPAHCPWQVATYAPRGETELVFAWPARREGGGQLQRAVRLASWRDSVGGPAPGVKPAPWSGPERS